MRIPRLGPDREPSRLRPISEYSVIAGAGTLALAWVDYRFPGLTREVFHDPVLTAVDVLGTVANVGADVVIGVVEFGVDAIEALGEALD